MIEISPGLFWEIWLNLCHQNPWTGYNTSVAEKHQSEDTFPLLWFLAKVGEFVKNIFVWTDFEWVFVNWKCWCGGIWSNLLTGELSLPTFLSLDSAFTPSMSPCNIHTHVHKNPHTQILQFVHHECNDACNLQHYFMSCNMSETWNSTRK